MRKNMVGIKMPVKCRLIKTNSTWMAEYWWKKRCNDYGRVPAVKTKVCVRKRMTEKTV